MKNLIRYSLSVFSVCLLTVIAVCFLSLPAFAQRPMGVDVSSYQGSSVNWATAKANGISFAWAKATEGLTVNDSTFTVNMANAKTAGVYIGAYHFAHPELHNPSDEAAHFWSIASSYIKNGGTYLMPMLDYERFTNGVVGATSHSDWAIQWNTIISNNASATGVFVKPIVYVSACNACYYDSSVSNFIAWIACYNGQSPATGTPWSTCTSCEKWGTGSSAWTLWQYTDSAPLAGATQNPDGDVFNGTSAQLVQQLVIGPPPYITSQPSNRYGDQGGSLVMRVGAGGLAPLKYQWRLNGANVSAATNATLTLANITTGSAGSYTVVITNNSGSITSSIATVTVNGLFGSIYSDNFDVNSAANWTVNKSSSTQTRITFAYDYSVIGVPVAPHTTNGTTKGLRLEANLSSGAVQALNASPIGQNFTGDYRLHFDMWINVNGPLPGGGTGSTELVSAGIGTVGNRVEWNASGSTADGVWFTVDGDGGVGSGSLTQGDYAAYIGTNQQASSTGVYVAGTQTTARTSDDIYYANLFPSGQTPPLFQQTNYAQQTGGLAQGAAGLTWRDVAVNKTGNVVEWFVDGLKICSVTNAVTGTNIFVGYWDPFASVSDNTNLSFGLIDNLRVELPVNLPVITTQPVSRTDNAGTTATYTVAATGNFITYQWQKNGASLSNGGNVAGATSAALTLTGVAQSDAASYRVIVANAAGSVTSSVATLTVIDPPSITAQPSNQTANAGATANFTAGIGGTAPFTYQWQKNSVALTDGGNVAGSATATLTLTGVSQTDAANYRVVVSNPAGTVTSSAASLTVIDPPAITSQPSSVTANAGTIANFSATVTGTSPSLHWRKNGVNLSNGGNVLGATTASLTLTGVSQSDAASYTVVGSNPAGSATSSAATLTVIDPPVITVQPGSATANAGATANFSATVTGTSPNFQWQKNGVNLNNGGNVLGATTAALTLSSVTQSDAASYTLIASNSAGSVTSSAATLTVIDPPAITVQPASVTANAGTIANFSATVTGTSPAFQWQKNGASLVNGGNLLGATTASLTLTGVSQSDAASYSLVASNAAGTATSSAATLTVIDPPVITAQPASVTANAGTTANFTVTATGTSPSFQWSKNGVALSNGGNVAGATSASLTLTGVSQSDAASYVVVASNAAGSATSSTATLTVIDPPVISTQPASQTVNSGTSVTFTVSATGTAPFTYQWYFEGGAISGATTSSYNIASAQTSNIGYYYATVSNSAGQATSSNASLQIGSLFFADTLDANTSANWFIATNQSDSRATWAFDYSLRADRSGPGVPQNPFYTNTSKALKLEANLSSGLVVNAISLSPKTLNSSGDFQLRFDAWQNFVGPAPGGGTGSTEHISAGICHPGNTVEVPGITLNGGVFVAFDGDGGVGSGNVTDPDYGMYTNRNATTAAQLIGTNTGCYVASNSGGAPTTWHGNSYYTNVAGNPAPTIQLVTSETNSLLAGASSQTNTINAGSFGFKWHEVILRKTGTGTGTTNISCYIDGFRIVSITNGFIPATGTNVSIGYFDAFASIAATNFEFALFSNVKAESFTGAGVAPTITSQPVSISANGGTTATFSVAATSPTTLRYQWQKNSVNLSNGGNVTGATSATLSLSNVQNADAATYRCVVLNDSSYTISSSANLTVIGGHLVRPPAQTGAPILDASSHLSASGTTVSLSGSATPNSTYVVEAASSLTPTIDWTPVATNTVSADGIIQFNAPVTQAQQYFRIQLR